MLSQKRYLYYREEARQIATLRIAQYAKEYHVTVAGISIRNQRTRWGSCSSKGNLSFNYRIVFLPQHLQDYVFIHELCHLIEFNHSTRFWELVALCAPEYKHHIQELRRTQSMVQ
jgi:predicted metal-dependent hydrolase